MEIAHFKGVGKDETHIHRKLIHMKNPSFANHPSPFFALAQVFEFVEEGNVHRVFKDNQYLLETVFNAKDGAFVFTRGGFYSTTEKGDEVAFEFNSNFAKDSLKSMAYSQTNGMLFQPPMSRFGREMANGWTSKA